MSAAVAIETSSRRGSVAVRAGARQVERMLAGERSHARDLLPVLDGLLASSKRGRVPLEAVVVGTGPGSFTGLRVGIATAYGLVRGTGAALRGVSSFDSLAFGELSVGEEALYLFDARAGALFFAHYVRRADDVEPLRGPMVLTPAEVPKLLSNDLPILGDETVGRAVRLDDAARDRLRTDAFPRAGPLLELGLRRLERLGPQRLEEVEPLYLRPFAARKRGSGR